ncbi:MAG: elongation factor Ts [Bacilli bacterium]|nr:elongation factor Ts [Bacilli bacterium]
MVNASLIKELRDKTGAGMMDCKKALVECNGDVQAAIDWLREKGIAKAAKKASRIAAEGLCDAAFDGNYAYLYELNSETDFVAKNEKFITLMNQIGEICVANKCESAEAVLGLGAEELVVNATATIGEKISLRRVQKVEKTDAQVFGFYKHMGGKIATLVVLEGGDAELAKDISMHVTASRPLYISKEDIPGDYIEKETHIQMELTKNDEKLAGKPEAALAKIVEGKVNKQLKEICLLDQVYVKGSSNESVAQFLNQKHASIVTFVRYEVGEGMEKRVDDFAAEVAAAANAAANKQ